MSQWFIGSFVQLCMDSFMSFHSCLNQHLLICWCASQLQPFSASGCFWQRLSYKPLISYIAISFCSKLPPRQGPGTIWYPKSASCADMPHLLTWNLVPYMDPWMGVKSPSLGQSESKGLSRKGSSGKRLPWGPPGRKRCNDPGDGDVCVCVFGETCWLKGDFTNRISEISLDLMQFTYS